MSVPAGTTGAAGVTPSSMMTWGNMGGRAAGDGGAALAATVMNSAAEPVRALASVMVTVNPDVAAAVVGVPEMTPAAGSRDRPSGRAPLVTAQVNGDVPPVSARACEYA